MSKKNFEQRPELEALLSDRGHNRLPKLSPEAESDVRYLAKRVNDDGKALSSRELQRFLLDTHQVSISRAGLASLLRSLGLTPWWQG